MMPASVILIAWIIFGGSHLAMSSSQLRNRLKDRLSAAGFTLLFVCVTIATMTILIAACALYADQGRIGPALGQSGPLKWLMRGSAFFGAVLMVAGLINFPRSPFAALASRLRSEQKSYAPLSPPNGLERITRHPFFVGLSIVSVVHMLQANTLASAVYFAGFAVTSLLGIYLQDQKLRQRWNKEYSEYELQTGKIVSLQKPDGAQQPWLTWTAALIVSTVLFIWLHPIWAFANGATFAFFILIFGTLATVAALLKSRIVEK